MSLEGRLTAAVNRAFIALDDLAGTFTINEIDTSGYDPVTGNTNEVKTPHTVTGIFDSFDTEGLDKTVIESSDLKVLVLPIDAFKPSVGDTLIANSIEYTVMDVGFIRAYDKDFLWELRVRK